MHTPLKSADFGNEDILKTKKMFRKDATACPLKNDLEVLEGISYSFFKADPCVNPQCTILLNILSFAQMFALWRENFWVISKVTWYLLFIKSTYWITKTGCLLQADQIQALLRYKYGEETFQCGSWPLGLMYAHTTPPGRARTT